MVVSVNSSVLKKIRNKEYISKDLFNKSDKNIIPYNFNLDLYNDNILNKNIIKYNDYFESLKLSKKNNITLDNNQKKVVLADEDYLLVLAGAGTGKTTTLCAKVDFLVKEKHVNEKKILVMSYTKKATEELKNRLEDDLGIFCDVTTFHSLGFRYIRQIFSNHKCYVVDDNTKNDIFLEYFENLFQNKEKVLELLNTFQDIPGTRWLFSKYFKENYNKFKTYHEFLEGYKNKRRNEIIDLPLYINNIIENSYNAETLYTLQDELVKSVGEAKIANFLFTHNIPYKYEKIYKDMMDNNHIYQPDFTVFIGETKIYIEYFGLEGNSSTKELLKYQAITKMKIDYHLNHKNNFIAIYKKDLPYLETYLTTEIEKFGFKVKTKNNEKIFNDIMNKRPLSQIYPLKDLFYNVIDKIKSANKRNEFKKIVENSLKNESVEKEIKTKQYEFIKDFYLFYQTKLYSSDNYGFDFPDMIYYASKYINYLKERNDYEYIIIDEYQDISEDRYNLVHNITKDSHAKIIAFGDDWQAIYSFNGGNINYIYNFSKYFPNSKLMTINNTYRNSKEIVNYSKNFILKNNNQINKELISTKSIKDSIKFVIYNDDDEYTKLKKVILNIFKENKNKKILILGRTNEIINNCYNDEELIDSIGTKLVYKGYDEINIDAMTIHKSKGLTYDEVILLGLTKNFPNKDYNKFWLCNVFSPPRIKENVEFAEERRIFYVAMTRTLNHLYLFVPEKKDDRSPYIKEIYDLAKNNID